jgi:hypothetical protein
MSQLKHSQAERELFLTRPFILFRSSMGWMRLTHLGKGNLLYLVWATCFTWSVDSKVNLIQKHPHRHTEKWSAIVLGPFKLILIINHYLFFFFWQNLFIQHRLAQNSLHSPNWPQTHHPLVSDSQVLGLHICTTHPDILPVLAHKYISGDHCYHDSFTILGLNLDVQVQKK